jgi:geranylgeranyl reductase family protein
MRIAIVGAGPAGCQLAHRLGGTEHEILLSDPRAPYEKPCGGGLSPLVGRLFPDVMDLPFARHRPQTVRLRASDGQQLEQPLKGSAWAVVSRREFGEALLDRALASGNVSLVQQQVTDINRVAKEWRLRTARDMSFAADFLVGADGVRSVVRKHVVGPIPKHHLALAVGHTVRGMPDILSFQTDSDLQGYLWSFPRRAHASVGIVSRLIEARLQDLWERLERFLSEVSPEAKKERRWAALIPMALDRSLWDTPCVGPDWALLGDAAGHVHPITGEGIAYALWSAELLSQALLSGDPLSYDCLWQEAYSGPFISASEMMQRAGAVKGAYEILLPLSLMTAFSS